MMKPACHLQVGKAAAKMENFSASYCYGIAMLVVMVATVMPGGCGQDTSCLNQLVPCLNYLNGTKDVPSVCCDPLENVIKSDPECICSMISNRGSKQAEQAGINVTEAQQLPGRCGLRVNPLACLTGSGPSSNNKNSVNSSSVLLIPSWSMIATATFSMILCIL